MLPSKGKFALYSCPYLPSNTCVRPYCQFKHTLDDNAKAVEDVNSLIQAQEPEEKFEEETPSTSSFPLISEIKKEIEEDDLIPQLEALFGMEGAPKLPEYQPTPISELKPSTKSTKDSYNEYNPQELSKPIKVEEYVPKPVKVEEYVPTTSCQTSKVAAYVPTKKSSSKDSKSKSRSSDSSRKSKSSSSSKSSKSSSSHDRKEKPGKSSSSRSLGKGRNKIRTEEVVLSSSDDDNDNNDFEPDVLDVKPEEIIPKSRKKESSLKRPSESLKIVEKEVEKAAEVEIAPEKKRRIAHATKIGFPKTNKKPIRPVVSSVGQVLTERWKKQQELKLNPTESNSNGDDLGTRIGSHPKGKSRIAHHSKPEDKSVPRPKIIPSPSKVPAVKRQYVLDQLVEVCLTVYGMQSDAFAKAVEVENAILAKATTSNVYTSLFISQKRLLDQCTMPPPMGTGLLAMAPQPTIRTIASVGADSKIHRIGVIAKQFDFKGEFLHKMLSTYLLSREELKEHGFPLAHESESGRAVLHTKDDRRKKMAKESQRECFRCGVIYSVDEKGMPEKLSLDDLCIYHPKRTYKKRRDRSTVEDYYMCCDRPMSSEGCESNSYHVSENPHYDHLSGFVSTKRSSRSKHKTGVFAVDCEMCLTSDGTSMTRVTVIDEQRNNIYDALVKPDKPVLDYITRFSGITEEMLTTGKTKSLRQVQKDLLQIFRAESILIGHSLQGDLMVLKMIHKNVVDTSIVFPHREGLPKRRALKNLAKDYLMRLIQVEESGHDSSEDAMACLDLMLYRVKEDAKSL